MTSCCRQSIGQHPNLDGARLQQQQLQMVCLGCRVVYWASAQTPLLGDWFGSGVVQRRTRPFVQHALARNLLARVGQMV